MQRRGSIVRTPHRGDKFASRRRSLREANSRCGGVRVGDQKATRLGLSDGIDRGTRTCHACWAGAHHQILVEEFVLAEQDEEHGASPVT